jgi:hypothetical protein
MQHHATPRYTTPHHATPHHATPHHTTPHHTTQHHATQRHLAYLESQPSEHEVMRAGLDMLVMISYVDDTEIFKSCLDYWQLFVAEIFASCTAHALPGERVVKAAAQCSLSVAGCVCVCVCVCVCWCAWQRVLRLLVHRAQ